MSSCAATCSSSAPASAAARARPARARARARPAAARGRRRRAPAGARIRAAGPGAGSRRASARPWRRPPRARRSRPASRPARAPRSRRAPPSARATARGLGRQPRQPQQHRAGDRARPDRAHDRGLVGAGPHALALERRAAAGAAAAGCRRSLRDRPAQKTGSALGAEALAHQRGDRALAERAGLQRQRGRVAGDLARAGPDRSPARSCAAWSRRARARRRAGGRGRRGSAATAGRTSAGRRRRAAAGARRPG